MGKSACPVGPVAVAFAEQMQVARHAQRISQRTLSARLDGIGWPILPTGINAIENGSRRITLDDAVAIASVLKMTLPPQVAALFGPCDTCAGSPPPGFACTVCGAVGEGS